MRIGVLWGTLLQIMKNLSRIKKKITKDTPDIVLLEIEALLDGRRNCNTCPQQPECYYGSANCWIRFIAKSKGIEYGG